jgi:hypothetical protein
MINSLVLQTYSPIIIPPSFIYAVNYIEREHLVGEVGGMGFLILLASLLLYYDRATTKYRGLIMGGIILFLISYFLSLNVQYFYLNLLLVSASLFMIAYGLTEFNFYREKNQYILLSLLLLFFSFSVLMPRDRLTANPYSYSLLSVSIAFTILVFASVTTPMLK